MFALTRVNAKVTDDLIFKLFYRVFESESCACALIPVTAVRQTLFCRRHAATRVSDRGLNLAIVCVCVRACVSVCAIIYV